MKLHLSAAIPYSCVERTPSSSYPEQSSDMIQSTPLVRLLFYFACDSSCGLALSIKPVLNKCDIEGSTLVSFPQFWIISQGKRIHAVKSTIKKSSIPFTGMRASFRKTDSSFVAWTHPKLSSVVGHNSASSSISRPHRSYSRLSHAGNTTTSRLVTGSR